MGSSRGAMVRTVLELTTADKLYVLVGQEGISACLKVADIQCTYLFTCITDVIPTCRVWGTRVIRLVNRSKIVRKTLPAYGEY